MTHRKSDNELEIFILIWVILIIWFTAVKPWYTILKSTYKSKSKILI